MVVLTSRERVAKTFAHQEPDRVPLFELSIDTAPATALMGREMWVGGLGANAMRANTLAAAGRFDEYSEKTCRDTIDLWRALELDMITIPRPERLPRWSMERLDVYRWRFTEPGTGYWEEFVYSPDSNVYAQVKSSLDSGDLSDFERYINRLEAIEHRPEDYDLANLDRWLQGLQGIFVLMGADVDYPPSNKTWAKLFLEGMILRPDLIDRYLSAQMKPRTLMIAEAFKRGADGVLGGNDWASSTGPLISPKHFRRFILPHFRQLVDLCHANGKVMVKHTDGDIRRIESVLLEESGIDGWHPVDPTVGLTISDYKGRYGKQVTLIGNVNCATTLISGTRENVVDETKAIIQAGAPGGGFILSSSNSIHADVKPALYQAMLETARTYGNYPIERC
jgi:hypothetical protein